ncbi:hypothetical protein [Pseudonocardia alni]|uniref:hypothetical protein n=1 Tax=Pseudonocardia alni TaxID=33907 RepID=UPI00332DCFAC
MNDAPRDHRVRNPRPARQSWPSAPGGGLTDVQRLIIALIVLVSIVLSLALAGLYYGLIYAACVAVATWVYLAATALGRLLLRRGH